MRKNPQDKRRFLRFPIMGMVRLQQSPTSKGTEVYVANISRGGIGLYTHKKVQAGETYYIRPISWDNIDELWAVKAVWCKAEGDVFMAGFKFTSTTHQEFRQIKRRLLLQVY
jgi:PilZ domain